jgi:hypothetical protein
MATEEAKPTWPAFVDVAGVSREKSLEKFRRSGQVYPPSFFRSSKSALNPLT